jgi:hypothetical protein
MEWLFRMTNYRNSGALTIFCLAIAAVTMMLAFVVIFKFTAKDGQGYASDASRLIMANRERE